MHNPHLQNVHKETDVVPWGLLTQEKSQQPDQMANSVLTIIVNCSNGGPSFAFKILPVAKMPAALVYQQFKKTIKLSRRGSEISHM